MSLVDRRNLWANIFPLPPLIGDNYMGHSLNARGAGDALECLFGDCYSWGRDERNGKVI